MLDLDEGVCLGRKLTGVVVVLSKNEERRRKRYKPVVGFDPRDTGLEADRKRKDEK